MTLTTVEPGGRRPAGYAFGDGELAARRLDAVAELFEPASRAFLNRVKPGSPRLAVDVGCGPGHTTRLLAEVSGADRTVGIDLSPAFVELARSRPAPRVEHVVHDAVSLPWPVGPADLAYCRLLLAHLPRPAEVAAGWLSQLAPGGVLALDELEGIEPRDPVLADYEEVVVALVASRGGLMYAGPVVSAALSSPPAGHRLVLDEVRHEDVPVRAAARMFAMNLEVWRHDPAVVGTFGRFRIERLAAGLDRLARSSTSRTARWRLRQTAVARV